MNSRAYARVLTGLLPLVAVPFVGCGDAGGPEAADPPIPVVDLDADFDAEPQDDGTEDVLRTGPFDKRFDGVTLSVPAGWKEVGPAPGQTGFIDARFLIPAGDDEVELTCSVIGGGIEANIDRWIGQFEPPPGEPQPRPEPISAGGVEGTWIDLRGTFHAGSSGRPGPHPDWRMLGAAIPLGERDLYLKLNGPQEAVAQVHDEFRRFVRSARVE
jgi:hypothetical protein